MKITPDALLHRLKLALDRTLVEREVTVLGAGYEGYEQVRWRDGLLHPKQLVLPRVPLRRSAGQCRGSVPQHLTEQLCIFMLQCKLQIGSDEFICLLLGKGLRPVGNLAVPKDVDFDDHEIRMTTKDAA
jgi:hypothetical protein